MLNEQELVGRVIAGEPEAEEIFFKTYRPRLHRASMYFLGGQDSEAEDIVQDTFVIALPKLKDYVYNAPIYAWLRQICLRLCYARLRTRGRVLVSMEENLETYMWHLAVERLQTDNLEEQKQNRLELLRRLIERLNPESRQIVELRNIRGLSYALISQKLAIPMGTVMSRLARARDQIRKMADSMPDLVPRIYPRD